MAEKKGGRRRPLALGTGEAMPDRRFPPPWSVEETDACFIVRVANGQALAYVYFKDERHGMIRAAERV